MTTPDPIPDSVMAALEIVRSGGETNMMDRNAVIFYVDQIEDLDTGSTAEAVVWLNDNKPRYMEALIAMGKQRQ